MSRRRLALSVVVITAALLVGRGLSVQYAEFAWYDSLGARSVWTERAMDSGLLQGAAFAIALLFSLLNFAAAAPSLRRLMRPQRLANVEFSEAFSPAQLRGSALVLSIAIAIGLARLLPSWRAVALARLGANFAEFDPYTGHDLSFYVTWLPLERAIYSWAVGLVAVVALLMLALYVVTHGARLREGVLSLDVGVRRHLGILIALVLVLCAWSYRLDSYQLLTGTGQDGLPFGYVDHQWKLPGLLGLGVLTVATAVTVAASAWTGQLRSALVAIMVAVAAAAVVKEIVPFVLLRTTPAAEAASRNVPYLATRAEFTRRAFFTELERFLEAAQRASIGPPIGAATARSADTTVSPGATGTLLVDAPTLDVGGPSLGIGLKRLAQAWAARDFGLLSDTLKRRLRIVRVRDVSERVRALFPLFTVAAEPDPLYRADTLYWAVPLFSSSESYPLSDHREILGASRSYFRRIGTALVNARTGRVWAVTEPPPEPIAQAWFRRFSDSLARAQALSIQASLTGANLARPAGAAPGLDSSFRAQVERLYSRMRSALSSGDLRAFGLAYDSLGSLVERPRK